MSGSMRGYGYSTWSRPGYLGNAEPPPALVRRVPVPTAAEPPVWAGPDPSGVSDTQLSRAAMYQLAKAYAGSRLAVAEQAEDAALFARAPTSNAGAHLKAAYWMAVAARILGSRLLAAQAQVQVTRGNLLLVAPFTGEMVTGVGSILADAAAMVRRYAGSNGAALSVAARLDALAAEAGSLAAREAAAKGTLSPFDDLAVAREKFGRYAVIGGGALALLAVLYLLTRPRSM